MLGSAGKTAEAVRISNAAWYAAKQCPHRKGDRWAEIDAEFMTSEKLKIRDSYYERS